MENTKEQKKRKKLGIVLWSLAIAVIVGLSVTVGVLAATTATVGSGVNVTYTASEVAATVSGTWKRVNDATATNFETAAHATTIAFDGSEATASGTFETAAIALTSSNNSVTFTYTIQNDSTSKAINAVVTLPSTTVNNVTVSAGTASDGTDAVTVTAGTNHATDSFTVAAGATVTYTVTVSITQVKNDAAYAGAFSWNLTLAS